jgi:hypothetical protein
MTVHSGIDHRDRALRVSRSDSNAGSYRHVRRHPQLTKYVDSLGERGGVWDDLRRT